MPAICKRLTRSMNMVVRVERLVAHPVYKKYVKRRSTYKAHDEKNEFQVGDRVEIVETRPLSKDSGGGYPG